MYELILSNIILSGTRIGRVRVIFTLPSMSEQGLGSTPSFWPKTPLAYIEWYTGLKATAEPIHNMYSVKRLYGSDSIPAGSIIDLTNIRQSCMLFPAFGSVADQTWSSDNVLDRSSSFLVNNWHSMYSYKTIW